MDVDGDGVRMVKVVCPVCGKMGILQVRGNSKRVQHYVGYKNGKRKYVYHPFRDNLLPEASSLRSSGVGLRGFKSRPPHHFTGILMKSRL